MQAAGAPDGAGRYRSSGQTAALAQPPGHAKSAADQAAWESEPEGDFEGLGARPSPEQAVRYCPLYMRRPQLAAARDALRPRMRAAPRYGSRRSLYVAHAKEEQMVEWQRHGKRSEGRVCAW